MNRPTQQPELAVIIPVRNEAAGLADLFRSLADQRSVELELILCDDGSTDGTPDLARQMAVSAPFPVTIVRTGTGRGRQLNTGASVATAPFFLFLHADSRFADHLAFRRSLDHLAANRYATPDVLLAGRFAIRFRRQDTTPSLAYYYYESKARLDRPECSHGDQGLLMGRETFSGIGPFDETLPLLAETRLADTIRHQGSLLLLPAEIETSARRFETEGLAARQGLNAIIMNFAAQGWEPFFRELPSLYQQQDKTERLQLRPILKQLGKLISDTTPSERRALWLGTGRYIRNNAWQLAFVLDMRRNFRRDLPPGAGTTSCLDIYDRHLDRISDNAAGCWLAALLARMWLWWGAL
ncbi:MAG: glycosyl transferase [Geobacter sp.]|nr:MAG: glycosyl transferase [Geobacter sp.]